MRRPANAPVPAGPIPGAPASGFVFKFSSVFLSIWFLIFEYLALVTVSQLAVSYLAGAFPFSATFSLSTCPLPLSNVDNAGGGIAGLILCFLKNDSLAIVWSVMLAVVLRLMPAMLWLNWRYGAEVESWPSGERMARGGFKLTWGVWLLIVLIPIEAAMIMLLRPENPIVWENLATRDSVSAAPVLNWSLVVNLVLVTPFMEEIIFRLVLPTLLIRSKVSSGRAFGIACVVFGLFHLMNFFNKMYAIQYIVLQVLFGMVTGGVFLQEAFSASISVAIFLHVINNFFSVLLVPVSGTDAQAVRSLLFPQSYSDWAVSGPLFLTFFVHILLLATRWKSVISRMRLETLEHVD